MCCQEYHIVSGNLWGAQLKKSRWLWSSASGHRGHHPSQVIMVKACPNMSFQRFQKKYVKKIRTICFSTYLDLWRCSAQNDFANVEGIKKPQQVDMISRSTKLTQVLWRERWSVWIVSSTSYLGACMYIWFVAGETKTLACLSPWYQPALSKVRSKIF